MTLQWVFRWRGLNWGAGRLAPSAAPVRSEHVTLNSGQVWSRELPAGTQILCESGTLWLTLPGEIQDHVLPTGHSFTLPQPGKAVVQGMGDSEFRILGFRILGHS